MAALNNNDLRRVHLIIYSQADTEELNRESFAITMKTAFEAVRTAFTIQWPC